MATPDRPSPPPLTSAVRSKSPLTYSFAQQMPPLPSRPRTNKDPNFPNLSRPSPVSSVPAPTWPHSSTPQKATAAEVVAGAAKTSDPSHQNPDLAVDHRQQAEFALYTKLIPTTSAVPRNPGRSLGGGGLRATGSVSAPKTRPGTPTTPLAAPQPLPRQPMSSRMKSLSSEASKTQLARRVARTSRVNSATPPPTDTNESNEIAEIVKPVPVDPTRGAVAKAGVTPKTNGEGAEPTAVITQRMRETRVDTEEAFMRSIRSIYGNVDRDLPSRRSGSPASSVPRKSTEAQSATSQAQQSSRRLDEAFKSPSPSPSARYEGRRTPSPVPSRKDQIGALRRSSAVSPQPGPTSGPRKSINRDSSSTPVKNGRKTPTAETTGDAPPGFESRSSTMSRGAFLGRGKGDGDVGSVSKTSERERDPVLPRPANSRADAFRQAINTRRHSNSPRSASSRHATTPDSNGDDSSSGRLSLGREESRLRTSDKESSRQGLSASKQTMGVAGTPTHDRDRSRKKPDKVTLQKREERIMRRRFEMAAEVPEAVTVGVDSGSVTTTLEELPLKTNRTDSTKNLSAARKGQAEDKGFNMGGTDTQFSPLTSSKNRFVFAGSPNSSQVQLSEVLHPESVKPTEHSIAQTNLEPAEITTWVNGTTEVSDGDAEAIVNDLLENEDDYLPASSLPTVVGPTPRGKGPSMIDLMQGIHANEPSSSVLSTSDRQEDVLPPLPNSEEDVRFETMLRSMGWTPPEEDETIRNQRNGITVQSNHDPSRSNSSLSGIVGMRPTENGEMQSGYYSHFQ